MASITELYAARFGLPPVGTKLFIRVQQMHDYLGGMVQTTSAVVPDEEGWDSVANRVNPSEAHARPMRQMPCHPPIPCLATPC